MIVGMERRNLLAAILLLFVMPLMRFIEIWGRPETARAIARWRVYDVDQVVISFGGLEVRGVASFWVRV